MENLDESTKKYSYKYIFFMKLKQKAFIHIGKKNIHDAWKVLPNWKKEFYFLFFILVTVSFVSN